MNYRIVRLYKEAGIRRRIIAEHLTLEEAQAHCRDPETSSSTATSTEAVKRTQRLGAWFDCYEKMWV